MFRKTCFGNHNWSEWTQAHNNKKTYTHIKTIDRYCKKCGDTESRVFSISCTLKKKGRKPCKECYEYEQAYPQFVKLNIPPISSLEQVMG